MSLLPDDLRCPLLASSWFCGLVFLPTCHVLLVLLVLTGWVIPAYWSLASLPHTSLLPVPLLCAPLPPVSPVRLLDLSPVLLLPSLCASCLPLLLVLTGLVLRLSGVSGVDVLFSCFWCSILLA